jgi:hypothetical protein
VIRTIVSRLEPILAELDALAENCGAPEVLEDLNAEFEDSLMLLSEIDPREPGWEDELSDALEDLRASLTALEALFEMDEKELWMYNDNTEGAKQPIVDELERLAVQFIRVSREKFFGNAELRNLLAPQVLNTPQKPRAKRGKLREIDHDE